MTPNLMQAALAFDYVNHRNEPHRYKVIPIDIGWQRCKCFPGDPEKESWGMRALCLQRDNDVRIVVRVFALVKMHNIQEIQIEAG